MDKNFNNNTLNSDFSSDFLKLELKQDNELLLLNRLVSVDFQTNRIFNQRFLGIFRFEISLRKVI